MRAYNEKKASPRVCRPAGKSWERKKISTMPLPSYQYAKNLMRFFKRIFSLFQWIFPLKKRKKSTKNGFPPER